MQVFPFGRMIGENITIITVPGRDLGWVRADPSQLEQVLLNLAVNSRELRRVERSLNERPRQTLAWNTLAEEFTKLMR